MKKSYPEIRIADGWLLRANASTHLHELWAKEGDKLVGDEDMEKIVASYRKAWGPYEKRIIEGMCDLYGLQFRKNVIDVYIAPWFNAFSFPLVIGARFSPGVFVDTLAHELLHNLFFDNTSVDSMSKKLLKEWEFLFGDDLDFSLLVHIPVHAALQAMYLDVLDEPDRLKRDIEGCRKNAKTWGKPYFEAWEYVEKHGYKDINKQLKNSFRKLEKEEN